jgi:hypothetical protein
MPILGSLWSFLDPRICTSAHYSVSGPNLLLGFQVERADSVEKIYVHRPRRPWASIYTPSPVRHARTAPSRTAPSLLVSRLPLRDPQWHLSPVRTASWEGWTIFVWTHACPEAIFRPGLGLYRYAGVSIWPGIACCPGLCCQWGHSRQASQSMWPLAAVAASSRRQTYIRVETVVEDTSPSPRWVPLGAASIQYRYCCTFLSIRRCLQEPCKVIVYH